MNPQLGQLALMRRYPQRGFSRASRRISAITWSASAGRPPRRCACVHLRATSRRCQRRIVSGVTRKLDQRQRGSAPAQHRQQGTVGSSELGSLHLAAQHGELVAEHGDLDVLGVLASQASKQHAEESACREVEERQGHRRIIARPCPCYSAHSAEFLNPKTSKMHAPGSQFDEEQDIHPSQEDRVHAEEVAGQDAGGLLPQK